MLQRGAAKWKPSENVEGLKKTSYGMREDTIGRRGNQGQRGDFRDAAKNRLILMELFVEIRNGMAKGSR